MSLVTCICGKADLQPTLQTAKWGRTQKGKEKNTKDLCEKGEGAFPSFLEGAFTFTSVQGNLQSHTSTQGHAVSL